MKECFTTNDLCFSNYPLLLSSQHFNYNGTTFAIIPYGSRWRSLHHIATLRLLSLARLSSFTPLHAANIRSLLQSLFEASTSSGKHCFVQVNIMSRLTEMMFDMIVEMITGSRCCVGEGKRFVLMMEEAFWSSSIPNPVDFIPFLRWVGVNGLKKRMQRLGKEIDGLIEEIVDEIQRRRMKKEGKCTESVDANMTLVKAMLSMQEENPQDYTNNITKGMIKVLLLARIDTTAISMEWALALLLNHPEALQKVHDEIEAHIDHQCMVTDSDLSNLRYLNNVIKETLRLFPPGPLLIPRESTMECKVGDLHVPCGMMLLVNAHMVHRDPEVWANPKRFMPERFEIEEGEEYKLSYIR